MEFVHSFQGYLSTVASIIKLILEAISIFVWPWVCSEIEQP